MLAFPARRLCIGSRGPMIRWQDGEGAAVSPPARAPEAESIARHIIGPRNDVVVRLRADGWEVVSAAATADRDAADQRDAFRAALRDAGFRVRG